MNPDNTRGRFITIEGTEGVGKSTNVNFIVDHLRAAGKTVIATREPGGSPEAEAIRSVLLDSAQGSLPPEAELLLMFAARACHLDALILPALVRGDWVVCDRFTDATWAYQGGGRGLDASLIAALEDAVQEGLRPDLTLLLDAPLDVVDDRRRHRAVDDRFEAEDRAFFSRVQSAYRVLAQREPARIRLIDAGRPLADVQEQIGHVLDDFIGHSDDKAI